MRLLLIDDDLDLADTVVDYLEAEGALVEHAADGVSGLELAMRRRPDVAIIDVGLPGGMSGFDVSMALRRRGLLDLPILMLTARQTVEDKVLGFESGADDYLCKPFALAELLCRLRALNRRNDGLKESAVGRQLEIDDLVIDPATRTATRAGQSLSLTKLEFDILVALCRASPAAVDRAELERIVWDGELVDPKTIRTHIYQLRQVVDRPFDVPLIHTIRGFGHAVKRQSSSSSDA